MIPDTNTFNSILDGSCSRDVFLGHEVFVTHIQRDELQNTRNPERREELLAIFKSVESKPTPTKTAVWDDSRWDETNWSANGDLYDRLFVRIKELDRLAKKKKTDVNQSRDARIAEIAITNQVTLITNDRSLAQVTVELGGTAMNISEFQKQA